MFSTAVCPGQNLQKCTNNSVLVRATIFVMKHYDQKQLQEERIHLAYTSSHSPSVKKVKTGTQRGQEPVVTSQFRGHGGVLLACAPRLAQAACL